MGLLSWLDPLTPTNSSAWSRLSTATTSLRTHNLGTGTAVYPFEDRPQDIIDTIRPLEPVSWCSVPLALRITFPDATSHALRLTLWRSGSYMTTYSRLLLIGVLSILRSQAARLSIASCYTGPVAWLLPVKAGLCLRFRRKTQCVLRLMPTSVFFASSVLVDIICRRSQITVRRTKAK